MSNFFSRPMNNRQFSRLLLLAIILLTLPCYCLGAILLAYAPSEAKSTRLPPTNPTLGGSTLLPMLTATFTPFFTSTSPGGPLAATPQQFYVPATNTPFVYATWTPYVVPTSVPLPTTAPTLTAVPSATLAPTSTLIPTVPTSTPTNTEAPPPTDEQLPTEAPLPTDEPVIEASPTQEVLNP